MFNFYSFLRKKWAEYSPSSGRKGTVVDEICVKPTGLIMGDFYNALTDQRRVNDISQWESWTEDEMDFFGGKFFLPRVEGDFAFGSVRIWFDEKKNLTISEDARFITNGGFSYKARLPRKVSRSSFHNSTDNFGLYYIDIPIIATSKGDQYNVIDSEITTIEGVDFEYKTVANLEQIDNGSRHESNEEYYNRLIYAINDRSMMSKASMNNMLPTIFPVISSMYIAGPGDRYMTRDLVSGGDISRPTQKVEYLGKTTGESLVKNIGFYTIFPPEVGSFQKEDWGPFSIQTDYQFPLTIDPSSLTASISSEGQTGDPAFNGFDLEQELTNAMYRGLYFDDYKLNMELETSDLFNIQDEDVGFDPVMAPNSTWIYGAVNQAKGNMGPMVGDDISSDDVLFFQNNNIVLAGGAQNSFSIGKDIGKRTGVKLTGTISIPEISDDVKKSSIEILIGGTNQEDNGGRVDGYIGIGFGIHIVREFISDSEITNAAIYFAHREKYGSGQVFGANEDFIGGNGPGTGHIAISNLGALGEMLWRVQPGIEYDFEFILHDDLRLTLYLYKNDQRIVPDPDNIENSLHFELPTKVLGKWSQELFDKNTNFYGTTMKITLDTDSQDTDDQWTVGDLKAFDTQLSRATALFAMNVRGVEDPVSVYLRSFGYGSVNGVFSQGYTAYIWDKEVQTIASGATELTSGGWSVLDKVSNSNGSKNVLQSLLRHDINNMDRFRIQSRYGENIFIMISATGSSQYASRYFGNNQDDIQSKLQIDYLKLQSQTENMYHANNKADIHVSTVRNTTNIQESIVILQKGASDNFFEMSVDAGAEMPVDEVVSVVLGSEVEDSEVLANTEYTVIRPDPLLAGSSQETVRIVLDGYSDETITVRYTTYPEVNNIQNYFDGTEYGKLFGDILVKHKVPIYLSFILYYSGNTNDDQMVDEIKKYVDDNIDGTFSIPEMIRYLYSEQLASRVTEPLEISYSRTNDEGDIETGTFTDKLTARDVDYFRIQDLTVSKL